MAKTKLTEREMLELILELGTEKPVTEDIIEKATAMLEAVNKRASKQGKENEPLLEEIRAILSDEPKTASEVRTVLGEELYTVQKVSALLRILFKNDEVEKLPVQREGKSAQIAYSLI